MPPANRKVPKRAESSDSRYTVNEFLAEYPDDEACLVALWRDRYSPDGEHAFCPSPSCKTERTFKRYATTQQRQSWTCTACGHHLHPTAGTIFHKSSTSLRQWFYCMFLMTSTRCGISAKQVERELGCAYKTAARMMRLIRTELMTDEDDDMLVGTVEADEVYIGGKLHRYPRTTQAQQRARKQPVLAMIEREGRVRAFVMPTAGATSRPEVEPVVLDNVKADAVLMTDESGLYANMHQVYEHYTINHSHRSYARGEIHTQTIEGWFATVKAGLHGVFHGVSRRWLQSYMNEYTFRYNHREGVDPFKVLVALASRPVK